MSCSRMTASGRLHPSADVRISCEGLLNSALASLQWVAWPRIGHLLLDIASK